MKITVQSSELLKPIYPPDHPVPSTTESIALSVFDNITYRTYIPLIYAIKPPNPSNQSLQLGLQKALSEYREWAGRLDLDEKGHRVILLNDEGLRFVEASADCDLEESEIFQPSTLLTLHPSLKNVEELALVQLTRFNSGTLVVSFSWNHMVADGFFVSKFMISWGQSCRRIEMYPLPFHDRSIFVPRDPPKFDLFDHRSIEYTSKMKEQKSPNSPPTKEIGFIVPHFSPEFVAKIKSIASSPDGSRYSTFVSVVAHLWRAITRARGINETETTKIRVSVNGRSRLRMSPRVPDEYCGNLVLWAFPKAQVKELLNRPLSYAAKMIHEAIAGVNDEYFKSFIDFASCKADEEEDLMPEAHRKMYAFGADLEVDSWIRFPFDHVDFGVGKPCILMPSFVPLEGLIFLNSSLSGDGGLNAYVSLFKRDLGLFERYCYSLD